MMLLSPGGLLMLVPPSDLNQEDVVSKVGTGKCHFSVLVKETMQ